MKPEKSLLYLIPIVFLYIVASWFVTIVPYAKAKQFFASLPALVKTNLVDRYPSALEIKVTNGIVSLNQKTPYCFLISNNAVAPAKLPAGIVVDPNAHPDISLLSATGPYSKLCQPVALVGSNFAIFPDQNNSFKTQSIPTDVNVTINRNNIVGFTDKYLPSLESFGLKVYFIIPFIGSIFIYLFLLLVNLWYAVMVRFACKIFKKPVPAFGQAYRLSLFFYCFLLVIDWYFVGALNYFLKTNLDLSFFLRNTFLISAASLYYYSRHPTTIV
jgi:hypothetical protein